MNQKQLFEKIQRIQQQLMQGLIEREQTIKLAFLATLSGEHILLIGPPGTGKSMVARRIHLMFKQTPYFERLLTRFSVPEELFGPLSIKALEQDQYTRLTQGYLPQASIAFLDEIFKANSAILNALLTLLNEREFDNGIIREKAPLLSVIGASNELPESEELSALFDRFLFRQYVAPVSRQGFKQLLTLKNNDQDLNVEQLSLEEVQFIQKSANHIELSAEVVNFLVELRKWCHENQIQVSDRRWRKIVHMLKVSAFTNGQSTVSIWDCWLVQHCIWEKPEQVELVAAMYEQYCGKAVINIDNLVKVVEVLEKEVGKNHKNQISINKKEIFQLESYNDPNIPLIDIKAPELNKKNGKILKWNKTIGSTIEKDEIICIIESMNNIYEVISPIKGTISHIFTYKDDSYIISDSEVLAKVVEIQRTSFFLNTKRIVNVSKEYKIIEDKLARIFPKQPQGLFDDILGNSGHTKEAFQESLSSFLLNVYSHYPIILEIFISNTLIKYFNDNSLVYPSSFDSHKAFEILQRNILEAK